MPDRPAIRILSYLPNPRVSKALIAAEYCGVTVELVGDEPRKLGQWLWDFDARELAEDERTEASPHARTSSRGFRGTLYKTDAFLRAHPMGTVPAAFSPDGSVGIFESNSILRAVARVGDPPAGFYGRDGYEASRVDSFLDACLVFAREAQVYLLGLDEMDSTTHERMKGAYEFLLAGAERALGDAPYLATGQLTIADIGFVCDVLQFFRERRAEKKLARAGLAPISRDAASDYPRVHEHITSLCKRDEFRRHLEPLLD